MLLSHWPAPTNARRARWISKCEHAFSKLHARHFYEARALVLHKRWPTTHPPSPRSPRLIEAVFWRFTHPLKREFCHFEGEFGNFAKWQLYGDKVEKISKLFVQKLGLFWPFFGVKLRDESEDNELLMMDTKTVTVPLNIPTFIILRFKITPLNSGLISVRFKCILYV